MLLNQRFLFFLFHRFYETRNSFGTNLKQETDTKLMLLESIFYNVGGFDFKYF